MEGFCFNRSVLNSEESVNKNWNIRIRKGKSSLSAVSFLRQVNLNRRDTIGDRLIIMGGGGVAFDCAFTAKRLGASEINVVCVEGTTNMCASPEDVAQAKKEGIMIHNSQMISKVLCTGGKSTGIECFEISSFQFDQRGCLSVQTAPVASETISRDMVISAVGVQPDLDFLNGNRQFRFTLKGMLKVDPRTLSTSVDGVFAAGDVVTGPSTVAQAIGIGRHSAIGINRYLSGNRSANLWRVSISEKGHIVVEDSAGESEPHEVAYKEIVNVDYFEKKRRQSTNTLPLAASIRSFEEINRGLGKDNALIEAARCFHCGYCTFCGCCVEDCPGLILSMTSQGPRVAYFDECWHCGCCRIACPSGAILYEFPLNMLV